MENLIDTLLAEPIYGLIAVVLAALILYSLVKKVIKMMIFLIMVFGLYLAYLGMTGREIPTDGEQLKDAVLQDVDKAKGKLKEGSSDVLNKAQEKIKKEIKEGAKEGAKEIVNEKINEHTKEKRNQ
jgi:hypothetical protein